MANDNGELKLTITQDKLVDILMHAATREDIAKLDSKIDVLETKIDAKIDKLDAKIDALETKIDAKINKLDAKIDALETKIDARIGTLETKVDGKIDKLDAKIDKVIWGIIIAIIAPIAMQILSHYIK